MTTASNFEPQLITQLCRKRLSLKVICICMYICRYIIIHNIGFANIFLNSFANVRTNFLIYANVINVKFIVTYLLAR